MDSATIKRLKKVLSHMKSRCYDSSDKRYEDWGGRGISICNEWLENPNIFIQWCAKSGYRPGLTIDRIDNNGSYCPENCRWVTISENNQNRRSSRYFTYNGKTMNLQQWCDEYNVSRSMVYKRLQMGWDFEKALTTPKRERDSNTLISERFGRLTVMEFIGKSKFRQSLYRCKCDCGNTTIVDGNKLKSAHTVSCGCFRKDTARKNLPRSFETNDSGG